MSSALDSTFVTIWGLCFAWRCHLRFRVAIRRQAVRLGWESFRGRRPCLGRREGRFIGVGGIVAA